MWKQLDVYRFSSFIEFEAFFPLCTKKKNKQKKLESKLQDSKPTHFVTVICSALSCTMLVWKNSPFPERKSINICEMLRYCDKRDPVSTQTDVSATSGSRFHSPVRGLALMTLFNYLLAKEYMSFPLISHNPTEIPSGKNIG